MLIRALRESIASLCKGTETNLYRQFNDNGIELFGEQTQTVFEEPDYVEEVGHGTTIAYPYHDFYNVLTARTGQNTGIYKPKRQL